MADGAMLGGYSTRRTDGMFRLVVRLRRVRRADVVAFSVAEPPEGDQQQEGNDPRRTPQPSQEHAVFQISILPGCFR